MSKPDTPSPPNPTAVAGAQTSTNVNTAVANAFLNNMNQVTPTGSLDYNATGTYSWTDPTTGSTYNIPRFTATQTLSPTEQAIQNQTEAAKYNLAGMANAQSGSVAQLLATPFDPNASAPAAGNASGIAGVPQALTSFAGGGSIQGGLGPSGQITQDYGPASGFSADRDAATAAAMARVNPQLDIQKQRLQQQLADQGIRYGSDAYNNAFVPFNQQQNDAWNAAVQTGDTEQMNLVQMAAQRAAFQNAAQQQGYTQQLGAGEFANQAQQQQFGQNASQATFANAGLAQQLQQQQAAFNASQTARNQNLQEQYAQRNQPINEITSLMSGSQVQNPNWLNTPSSQIPTTDIAGITQANFQNQLGIYQQQNQNYQQLMGGILGLGAGAVTKYSDERMKDNVVRMGTVFAANDDGERSKLPIYSYSYKADPMKAAHIGPMAQDVEKIQPGAVSEVGGRKVIDVGKTMGSILKAA